MRIVLEASDFPEASHRATGDRALNVWVPRALDYAFTLEVQKLMRTGSHPDGRFEATFRDIGRQNGVRLVGPVEIEFVPLEPAKGKTRPERTLH